MVDGLYMTPRTYFDSGCDEYKTYPLERKLLDIGYAIWHGHDIKDDVSYIRKNYAHVSDFSIRRALWQMLARVNNVDDSKYLILNRNNSVETDIEILSEDLMRVFRLPAGNRSKAYLAKDPRFIRFCELDAMNGWKTALEEEEQAYELYSDGHWIMFPGDGEIIRKFNLTQATQTRCYPSYTYPEPWYGGPTRAKVIVLGNETRYDDFISRIQNVMLRRDPRCAEGVQICVDKWIELSYYLFYDQTYSVDQQLHISYMDLYNSPTYRFWLTEFRRLAFKLDIATNQDFYNKIAVINANPYPSIGVEPLGAGMLPSHYFLRQLVRFITHNNPEVLFVIPSESLRRVWRIILGDVYTDLVAFNRLIVSNKGKSISLTHSISKAHISELRRLLNH